jgi:hypothetical protein
MKHPLTLLITLLLAALATSDAAHEPKFSVNTEAGTYSFETEAISLKDIRLQVGNPRAHPPLWDVLKGATAQPGATERKATYSATDWFWELTVNFEIVKDGWLQVSLSAKNLTAAPRTLDPIKLASFSYRDSFKGKVDEAELRYYYDDYFIWGASRHTKAADGKNPASFYFAALYQPGNPALVVGFKPPHDWSDQIRIDGNGRFLVAEAFNRTPYIVGGGETAVFDPLLIGTHARLTDGLSSFGKFYTPRTPASATKKYAGWNSWEYFYGDINRERMLKVANGVAARPQLKSKLNYLVLDDGWQKSRGNWAMNEQKFGSDIHQWVKECKEKGFTPGVWMTPTYIDFETVEKHGFKTPVRENSTHVADPSDPNYRKYLYGQLRALRDAGVRYFKTDFLASMDTQTGHYIDQYYYSKEPGNRVLREFYKGIREAIGEDSFWLACGTTTASMAGLADASRIGTDITANWGVTTGIYREISTRFWYHGNLWLNDPDFLIVMGDAQLKPEAKSKPKYQPKESEVTAKRGYEGYTPEQAKTWATMIIMSGGLVTWADHPDDINEAGMKIVETVFEHGGGSSGVPLDLEETLTPTKWVRREGDRIYLAAINVGSDEIKVQIVADEVHELNGAKVAQDIFSGTKHPIQNGGIELTVPAFSSYCLLLK